MKHLPLLLSAALAIVTGTLTDKTTGQPLIGVTVTTTASHQRVQAKTDAHGHFSLGNLPSGNYTLRLSSPDVPAQSTPIRVSGPTTTVKLKACSTTLDYNCGNGGSPGGG